MRKQFAGAFADRSGMKRQFEHAFVERSGNLRTHSWTETATCGHICGQRWQSADAFVDNYGQLHTQKLYFADIIAETCRNICRQSCGHSIRTALPEEHFCCFHTPGLIRTALQTFLRALWGCSADRFADVVVDV